MRTERARVPARSPFATLGFVSAMLVASPSRAAGTSSSSAEVASPSPPEARARALPYTAALGLEASVVGLSFGPRAEFLWRLGPPGTWSHLRTTAGVMPGPEFVFVPIGIGYRAVFRERASVRPFVGVGYEAHFFVTDGPAYAQWAAIAFEGGCSFEILDRVSLGGAASLDWTFAGERGPGLQGRAFVALRF